MVENGAPCLGRLPTFPRAAAEEKHGIVTEKAVIILFSDEVGPQARNFHSRQLVRWRRMGLHLRFAASRDQALNFYGSSIVLTVTPQ